MPTPFPSPVKQNHPPATPPPPKPPNPERATERDDVLEKVSKAIDEALTERQRQALVAVAIDGVPLEIVVDGQQQVISC